MRTALACLAFLAIVAVPTPAMACSCAAQGRAAATRDADVVFTGTAVDVADPEGGGLVMSSGRPVFTTFAVNHVAKGDVGGQVVVVAAAMGASCGYAFEPGARYRVFGTIEGDEVHTGLCSGTTQLAVAPPGGAPAPPDAGPGDDPPARLTVPLALIATAATALLALGGTVALLSRRQRRSA